MTRIENEDQYRWAVARVNDLLPLVDDETPLNDPNNIELVMLSNLVADYSDKHFSIGVPTLVEVIKLRMYEMGINQRQLAAILCVSPSHVSEYLSGKEPTLQVAKAMYERIGFIPTGRIEDGEIVYVLNY